MMFSMLSLLIPLGAMGSCGRQYIRATGCCVASIRTTIAEARARLHDSIEAALRGEDVVVTTDQEHDRQVVRLMVEPACEPRQSREFGSARGLLIVPEDFDEPLDDVAEYQER